MQNISKIQLWMKKNYIDIFLINRTDQFMGEYIAPYAERLRWISNFSGSAGKALIFKKTALIFVDGRYTVQVKQEVNKKFKILHIKNFWKILKKNLSKKSIIGIDPNLISISEFTKIKEISSKKKSYVSLLLKNPIDLFWKNQPKMPKTKVFIHEDRFSGKSTQKKIIQIKRKIQYNKINYYILTSPESIAWLLNIRGSDIPFTPVSLCYAIISSKGNIDLFIDKYKIKKKIINKIYKINIHKFNSIKNYILKINLNLIIGFDKNNTPYFFESILKTNKIKYKYVDDPCIIPKAQKNAIELKGAIKANLRDGIALTKFIYWLKKTKNINKIDEIKASDYLSRLRKRNTFFHSLSFETISAFGKNSALPHYRVSKKSNLSFKKNNIYLVDSGAQYYDGTTDITRTLIIGKPNREQKDRFTRVLKGHIAVAKSIFGKKEKGINIDKLARKSLRDIKCDFDHGTGHGIGSFSSVHEGPQRISPVKNLTEKALIREGMILSNEPGFYKRGHYGIRTENLMIVRSFSKKFNFFEIISFAPIDIDLIELSLLNNSELEWINNYHKKVREKIIDNLNQKEAKWLEEVTSSLVFKKN